MSEHLRAHPEVAALLLFPLAGLDDDDDDVVLVVLANADSQDLGRVQYGRGFNAFCRCNSEFEAETAGPAEGSRFKCPRDRGVSIAPHLAR
ncbi:hypothetical protein DL766_005434 [Monosporascus sp. MC13-8B]|uniref:Uncharacterized protein n=1 Tax=Monosporascus cannonballus TaxID=155416 RepID=A0ABY0GSZ0_9PEZI|nr:hypothetical protein DL762_009888 [Monosporascus cannonballus]RYO96752.1 hypothetical protein DL763_003028 [Monosporascus cannonballus]RYP29337.1 hypothetical protein DL766_005434 [Monosporascus sp. MC13-8B]